MKPKYNNIPRTMRELPRWAVWRFKPSTDGKKPGKMPIDPKTGRAASISDPSTWGAFEEASEALKKGWGEDLNFACGDTDEGCDVAGIDIDHVRDKETGSINCQFSRAVYDQFSKAGAYIEASPSGTGLRIFFIGKLAKFGKGKQGFTHFEAYGNGEGGRHFLAVTGDVLSHADELPDCQKELDWFRDLFFKKEEDTASTSRSDTAGAGRDEDRHELTDKRVMELLRSAKNKDEFEALHDRGDLSKFAGDHSGADLRLCSMFGFYSGDHEQIDRLFRESKLVRDKWTQRSDYRESTIRKALNGLQATYQPGKRTEKADGDSSGDDSYTQAALARRLAEGAHDLMVEAGTGKQPAVHAYDSKVGLWGRDWGALLLAVMALARALRLEVVDTESKAERKRLNALADRLETRKEAEDVARLSLLYLPKCNPRDFDADPWMAKVRNGVLNLRTRQLWPDGPEHKATLSCATIHDPAARCPTWERVFLEICCGDKALAKFLQRWFGYTLTGLTTEQKMLFLYGQGENGKSLILRIISKVMGGYAWTTPTDTVLQRKSEASNDLFALKGRRFVTVSETESGQALASARIKALTGEPNITARPLYGEFEEVPIQFKLAMASNDKPFVPDTSKGFWRRMLLVPLNAKFEKLDPNLPGKLEEELPGILNWLLDGLEDWEQNGLQPPPSVIKATNEYKMESDMSGRFLEDSLPDGAWIKSSEFYRKFTEWCGEQGHHAMTQVKFSRGLLERGAEREKRPDGMWYALLGLRGK